MQEFIIIIMQTDDSNRIYDSTILGTQFSPIGNIVQSYWEHGSHTIKNSGTMTLLSLSTLQKQFYARYPESTELCAR